MANEIKTADELRTAFPALVGEIETAAAQNAVEQERQRIQDIEEVALPGFENIVAEAKFTKPVAAGDVAKAIVAEQRKLGGKYIQDRDDDAKNSGAGKVGAGAGIEGTSGKSGADEIDAALDKLFPETK